MKNFLFVACLPTLTCGFSMGAYDKLGRVVTVHRTNDRTPTAAVQPRKLMFLQAHSTEDVDKAFDKLQEELKNSKSDDESTSRDDEVDEMVSKSKMWVNRYFDLFAGISRDASATEEEAERNEKELRKTQKMTNKVIDFAAEFGQDLSKLDIEGMRGPSYSYQNKSSKNPRSVSIGSGEALFSPLYSIKDDPTLFQVQLELPGVDIGDVKLEIDKKENVLLVSGQRQSIESAEPLKFSKRFGLDSTIDTDKIAAKLDKGILTVTAPKQAKTDTTRRVPISPGN
mmetsp:Transcript_8189/g.15608  ORF Transcript_8189/g.15608 Transcript_8189/m.15608 type:complete len:283 (-) Transcript_8189:144-992(-)